MLDVNDNILPTSNDLGLEIANKNYCDSRTINPVISTLRVIKYYAMGNKFHFIALFLLSISITVNAQFIKKEWIGKGIKPLTQFSIVSLNNKWGLIDDSSKIVLPFFYDSINYQYVFEFKIYKAGKVGVAYQFGITEDTITSRTIQVLKVIDPIFDSIKTKDGFTIAFSNGLMAIYCFDGSLLFPIAKKSKVCSINPSYRYNFPDREKDRIKRLHKRNPLYANYLERLIFYKNQFYRLNTDMYPELSKPITVSKVKLTSYFKKQIKKQHLLECSD